MIGNGAFLFHYVIANDDEMQHALLSHGVISCVDMILYSDIGRGFALQYEVHVRIVGESVGLG